MYVHTISDARTHAHYTPTGSIFGHVLAYLRDGVVAVGCEDDVSLLRRLQREFDFCCLEPTEEQEVVLVVGGFDQNSASSSVERYDRRQDTWTAAVPMLKARSWFGLCVLSGEVYVAGCLSSQYRSLATVERHSPSSNTWSPVAAMPFARRMHCTCAVGEFMYVFGGVGERRTLKYESGSDPVV